MSQAVNCDRVVQAHHQSACKAYNCRLPSRCGQTKLKSSPNSMGKLWLNYHILKCNRRLFLYVTAPAHSWAVTEWSVVLLGMAKMEKKVAHDMRRLLKEAPKRSINGHHIWIGICRAEVPIQLRDRLAIWTTKEAAITKQFKLCHHSCWRKTNKTDAFSTLELPLASMKLIEAHILRTLDSKLASSRVLGVVTGQLYTSIIYYNFTSKREKENLSSVLLVSLHRTRFGWLADFWSG